MAYETGKTLPYEILYILGAKRNGTGLGPERARYKDRGVYASRETVPRRAAPQIGAN